MKLFSKKLWLILTPIMAVLMVVAIVAYAVTS